jgi:hypothetical protein
VHSSTSDCCLALSAAANGTATFTANTTGATYILNTKPVDFIEAEKRCRASGAHLVSYVSDAEQLEVEKYFTSTGELHSCCTQRISCAAAAVMLHAALTVHITQLRSAAATDTYTHVLLHLVSTAATHTCAPQSLEPARHPGLLTNSAFPTQPCQQQP